MDALRGIIDEAVVIDADTDLSGMVNGDVTVRAGVLLRLTGMVKGDVILEAGARLEATGMVGGRVVRPTRDA